MFWLGLVKRSATGNQVFYSANTNLPVFPELRALAAKTVGAVQVLRSALTDISDRVAIAFIYGSIARQEEKAESDIDLMVVGAATLEDELRKVGGVRLAQSRTDSPRRN